MRTDPELETRFERLAPLADDLDWANVVRRARELRPSPRSGRRRALLLAAALVVVLALAGAALALTGATTGVPAIDRLLDRSNSEIDAGPGEPRPDYHPLPGSVSEPLEFTVDDTRYTAVGFRNRQGAICSAQVEAERGGPQRDGMVACNGSDLRGWLARNAVQMFAGGGGPYLKLVGFARADVERIVVTGPTAHTTAKLSPPWSPEPWEGAPIRLVYVLVDAPAGRPRPGRLFGDELHIEAHLADGRVMVVRP